MFCQSQNEFIEKALQFYIGYLSSDYQSEYLTTALTSALEGTVAIHDDNIRKLLFKLAVEMSMMMHLIVINLNLDIDNIDKLRSQCVEEVKHSRSSLRTDVFFKKMEREQWPE